MSFLIVLWELTKCGAAFKKAHELFDVTQVKLHGAYANASERIGHI